MNFSELLKERRKERGLTLSALEELSDVSGSYISRIENGVNKTPSIEHALKLMKALDISLEELRQCYNLKNDNISLAYLQKDNILIKKAEVELINIANNQCDYKKSLQKIINICEELRKNSVSIIAERENQCYIVKIKLYNEKLIRIVSELLKQQYLTDKVLVIEGEVMNENKKECTLEEFLQVANEYFCVLEDDEYNEIKNYLKAIGY